MTTPTPTEARQDVRMVVDYETVWDAVEASINLNADEKVEVQTLLRMHAYALAAVSAAAPDERATDPLIVSAIRRRPSGTLRYEPANGPATGTSGRSFLAEYDAALAARPAPVVSGADVEYAIDGAIPDDLYGYRERYTRHAARRVLALLRHGDADHPSGRLTAADEGRAGA